MTKNYRFLLVEDEAFDAELNIREIKKTFPSALFERVDSAPEFQKMLSTFQPDVILSDYNMPTFDGLSALRIAKEICPLIPFIIVTGSINEDTAVECMKAGATDYVLKDSLKRLGSAVHSAIEQRALRLEQIDSEERLIVSEQSYFGLFNSVSEAIYIQNAEGVFIAVNRGAEKMYGYSAEEIIGQTPDFLAAPGMNDTKLVSGLLKTVLETGETQQFDFWGKRKNGEFFPKEVICNKGYYFGKEVLITTARDITERIKAEEALRESEERFRTLLDNASHISVQGYTPEGIVKYWNKASETVYQYTKQEAMGKNLVDLIIPPFMKEEVKEALQTMVQQGKGNQAEELSLLRKDGTSVLVYSNHSVIDIPGKEKELFCIDIDLSERVAAEEKLVREQKLLRTLIDNLPATIYVKDAECRKIIANRADLDVIGAKSEEEILGKTDLETFSNEIGARGYTDDKMIIETGIPVLNREECFDDTRGTKNWLLTSKIPLTDDNGKIIGLVGIGRDITEQKNAEEKILKLSKGIEQSPASILITDMDGNIEYVNPKFCESSGYSEQEAIGQNPRMLQSGMMPAELYNDLWQTIRTGNVWRGEMHNKKKDGTLFWEWATITAIKNDKNKITNYIAIKEDITDQKKMHAELIQAKEKAEESDQLKSAFLANMSHEIRTPLNSIIGFSELLSDPDFEQEQKDEFIRTIIENGNSLLFIISDIMDFSMLEAGQMKIRKESFSAKKLLNDLLNDFYTKAKQKGIEFRIDQSDFIPDVVLETDLYRIKQILNNLIGNAIKFTHEGCVEIGFKQMDESVEFHVRDTGIGISLENHQTIFERFRQIDTARTRKYGGNGLGLAISKNLVELLGGTIRLESEQNKFSDFFFTIPLKNKTLTNH